jgi:hypothetical protein
MVAVLVLVTLAVAILLAVAVMVSRLVARRRRVYELYELHLSLQDEALLGQVVSMVSQLGGAIRISAQRRLVCGQPFFAVETIAVRGATGMQWRIGVRCEPRSVAGIEAHLRACYPDVSLGRVHDQRPTPIAGRMIVPGYLLRLCKARSFVLALGRFAADGQDGPPLKALATSQMALGQGSVVRLQVTPAPAIAESLARAVYRQRGAAGRSVANGSGSGGSPVAVTDRQSASAQGTQDQGLFWLEVQVCSNDREECWSVAQALAAAPGANRLQVCRPTLRSVLYRRRFARGLAPLLPALSLRSLVSTVELAHLLELPSAAMKGVAVRRNAVPRLPADTDARRGEQLRPSWPATSPVPTAAPLGTP